MPMISRREQFAWAAGFYDDEGCTSRRKSPRDPYPYPTISISQKDRRVLERFREVIGFGAIYDTSNRELRHYSVTGFEKTQAIIAFLWPWLGPVKREQAVKVLTEHVKACRSYAYTRKHSKYHHNVTKPEFQGVAEINASKKTCKRGHPLTGDNLRIRPSKYGQARVCRTCQILNNRLRAERKKPP